MPLHDFSCSFCGHAFEAIHSGVSPATCPLCLSSASRGTSIGRDETPRQSLAIEARKLGVAEGTRARDGDDLEQYARQYGREAADHLVSDGWGPTYPPLRELRARAAELLPETLWSEVEDDIADAFRDGFVAACGDVYDDDEIRDEHEDA